MSEERLCILCAATQDIVDQCLNCLTPGTQALYFIEKTAHISAPHDPARCVRFDKALQADDTRLAEAFREFRPTDVILVCDRYEHDGAVEGLVSWNRAAGIAPRIFVYQNHILHEGFLETIRKRPALIRLPGRN